VKTLLITGGSGYLGSQLAQAALAQGWTVWATFYSHPIRAERFQATQLDLRDAGQTRATLQQVRPQAIVHTACSNRGDQPRHIVPAAQSVAAAARERGVRLVHVSSDTVFDGEHPPYADEARPAPVMDYGRAKAEAEALVSELYPAAVIVRPSLIWGLDPLDHQTRWLVDAVRHAERVTLFTDEFRCPVNVADLCMALLELAALPQLAGPLNLGGAQSLSRWDFGLRLLQCLGLAPGPTLLKGLSRDSGLERPRDLTLISRRASEHLKTRLRGVDEVLAGLSSA